MNIYAIPPLISSILFGVLGLFVFLKNSRLRANQIFGLMCLFTFWWQFSWFILFNFGTEKLAEVVVRIGYTGIIFIPITFYHFFILFLKKESEKPLITIAYLLGGLLLFFNWTSFLFIRGYYKYFWGYYPKAGILHPLYLLLLCVMAIRVFYLLRKELSKSKSSPFKYNQVKYLFCALGIYTLASLDFVINYGLEIYPPGFIFIMGSLGTVAYTIVRFRLMDISVAVTRAGIFAFVYALVLGIPFWVGYVTKSWFRSTTLMFILASIGLPIYNRLRRQAENRLLAEELKNHATLKKLARSLPLIHELDNITKLIVYRLVKNLKVSYAGIYLYDEELNACVLKSRYSHKNFNPNFPPELPLNHDFIKFITNHKKDFLYEDVQRLIQEEEPNNNKENNKNNHIALLQVSSFMKNANISLVIPNFLENDLIGFVALGHKTTGRAYSPEDIELLTTLSRSASLSILNALFSIELRKTEQELSETHRAAQLGYLASSIGHQVGNVLQNIAHIASGLLCNPLIMELFKDKQELYAVFEKHINDIFTNVEDGGMIVAEIRDYAQTDQNKQFIPINLKDVVDKTFKILYIPQAKFHTIDVIINISPDVPPVLGSSVQLQNVFINMCNNCYDATQEMKHHLKQHPELGISDYKGRIEINITRQKGNVCMHVIDNGMGIPQDVQKRLFTPLYTTKASSEKRKEQKLSGGTGIGLYTIFVIIKKHNGTIKLHKTEPLKGSDFLIELPVPKEGEGANIKGG